MTPNRAEEIAEAVVHDNLHLRLNGNYNFMTEPIAKALEEYAREVRQDEINNGLERHTEFNKALLGKGFEEGAVQMRERAANLTKSRHCPSWVPDAIMALPLTPSNTEEMKNG